jgi:two-component system cell cycle sensor histidine kinase/response regulator CckA
MKILPMKRDIVRKQELVLIMDDDPGVRDLARDVLEFCGHRVLAAGTENDAFTLCDERGKEISIVLLDTSRSEPAAADTLLDRIAAFSPSARVILTSIYNDDPSTAMPGRRPPYAFLKKPYRITELLQVFEKMRDISDNLASGPSL